MISPFESLKDLIFVDILASIRNENREYQLTLFRLLNRDVIASGGQIITASDLGQ